MLLPLLLLVGASGAMVQAAPTTPQFDQIVAFGDSLTDSGNVFAATGGTQPDPLDYWQGRFSNGPVWVEYLADFLDIEQTYLIQDVLEMSRRGERVMGPTLDGSLFNFAYGGAETGIPMVLDRQADFPPPFLDQLDYFGSFFGTIPANTLVTVWIGANDFLWEDFETPEDALAVMAAAVENIGTGLEELEDYGATDILVMNIPLSAEFNALLEAELEAFQQAYPNVNLYTYDTLHLFNQVSRNPGLYGITNVTSPALDQGLGFDEADGYLFWDEDHPTTAAHEVIAGQVYGHIFLESPVGSLYFQNETAGGAVLGMTSTTGSLDIVTFVDPDTINAATKPNDLIYGLVQVKSTLEEGETVAEIKINLPEPLPAGYSWFKYVGGQFVDFVQVYADTAGAQGAVISEDRRTVTLHITDNGQYDTNNTIGVVEDPSGAGYPAPPHKSDYDVIVAFGDSLSDSGNVYQATTGTQPDPDFYYNGRWSNGPVWVEQLADGFGITQTQLLTSIMADATPMTQNVLINNAFGGAQTGSSQEPLGFLGQVGYWDAYGMTVPDDSLVTVWIGANDVFAALQGNGGGPQMITDAVNNVAGGLQVLVDSLGAEYILVNSLPDLGSTPEYAGTKDSATLTTYSESFNTQLDAALGQFITANPGVRLYTSDMYDMFEDAVANPEKYDLTNTSMTALEQGLGFDEADGYMFWDGIHPTTAAHEAVAAEAYGRVAIRANVPEIAYLETNGRGNPVMGVVADSGTLTNVTFLTSSQVPSIDMPDRRPYGIFRVNAATGGASAVTLTFHLPSSLPRSMSWYKYTSSTGWVDFVSVYRNSGGTNGAVISPDRMSVTVVIQDNGPYDTNPAVGYIQDPMSGGSYYPAYSDGDSCFVDTVAGAGAGRGATALFLLGIAGMAALRGRRRGSVSGR